MEKERVVERIIAEVIDEINLQRGPDQQIGQNAQALLFGGDGPLDSLGLVQLIAELENRFEEAFVVRVNLADETLLEGEEIPFASVGALRAHLVGMA